MIRLRRLLTGRLPRDGKGGGKIPRSTVYREQLAAAMAWQILNIYPTRRRPFSWLLYKNLRGVLLADEVGGGKTFEAMALIAKHFLDETRGNRDRCRVLIVAAPSIQRKWSWCPCRTDGCVDECKNCLKSLGSDRQKFLVQAKLAGKRRRRLESLFRPSTPEENRSRIIRRKRDWRDFYRARQGIWLTSITALPPTRGRKTEAEFQRKYKFPQGAFDFIVADEAHIVRSGYRDRDEALASLNGTAVRKLHALLNANPSAKLLLLTATPFQNNVRELIQIIRLLENHSDRSEQLTDVIAEGLEGFQRQIDALRKDPDGFNRATIDELYEGLNTDITKLMKDRDGDDDPIERPSGIQKWGQRSGLDDFIRDVMVRNTKPQPANVVVNSDLSEKETLQYLLMRDLVYAEKTEREGRRGMASVHLSELVSSDQAFARTLAHRPTRARRLRHIRELFGRNLLFELKYRKLAETIADVAKGLHGKNVIVIYCRFIPTLEEIYRRLRGRFGARHVYRMMGRQDRDERAREQEKLEAANDAGLKPIMFVVSQVGNEGLDFDSFSKTVIHFDGHYNPAVMDQRNGRVYRRDNSARSLCIRQVLLNETYDQRIKFLEAEKRKMKDFYLGDGNMNAMLEQVLLNAPKLRPALARLRRFRIDLEPRRAWLMPEARRHL